ncbi:MAG TPA: hypothetical protein VFA07_17795 [Chthonomonadaceae bacterium]|nr:hypothetical protein [Chthonomonadaceae bacterium]
MKLSLQTVIVVAGLLSMPAGILAQPPVPVQRPQVHVHSAGRAPYAASGTMTTTQALQKAPKMDPSLAPLDRTFTAALVAVKKHPKDARTKKAFVDAGNRYGNALMFYKGTKLSRPVQYRAALAVYRKVLAVDPHDQNSSNNKNMIESIYRTMPGGIPK